MKDPKYNIKWLINHFESGQTISFRYFWGPANKRNLPVGNFCMDQWYVSPFIVDRVTYLTSEHWMMAHKALLFKDRETYNEIIDSKIPVKAKQLGRMVRNFDEYLWEHHRFNIVVQGNIHKFNQNRLLAGFLLDTGDDILVEASPVDPVWGIGLAEDDNYANNIYAWKGLNLLGFALMETRDFLREFGHFSPLANALPAPWQKHPGIDPHDMFWSMGRGDEYNAEFAAYYQKLSEREKTIYRLTNPAPIGWLHYYGD